jgi:trk system potassium uptake protein TrkA
MRRIGIVGAGRFGSVLAESLSEAGVETIVIDRDRTAVQNVAETATSAVEGDATIERTLVEAGFAGCDAAVIAIGSNVEVSTLATANCKELGIPMVVAKASSHIHGKILKRIGADTVIYPDRDSATRLARTLSSKGVVDLFEISDGCSLAEIDVPEDWKGKTPAQAEIRKRTGVTLLCIRRLAPVATQPRIIIVPRPDETILPEDKLIVFGTPHQLDELAQQT